MSAPHADTGTAPHAAGQAAAVPVPARADYLGALQYELRLADEYGDMTRAAELRAQIARLSAGTTRNPASETTSRPRAASRRKR